MKLLCCVLYAFEISYSLFLYLIDFGILKIAHLVDEKLRHVVWKVYVVMKRPKLIHL